MFLTGATGFISQFILRDLLRHHQDPFAIVRSIYEYFCWTLEPEALHKMEDWHFRLAEKRRTEKRHRYDLKDYGLTPEMVNTAFVRYRDFLTARGIRASRL